MVGNKEIEYDFCALTIYCDHLSILHKIVLLHHGIHLVLDHHDVVSFFCDTLPELDLYSLDDGDLVCDRIRATEIVSVLMHLKAKNIPWNNVSEKALIKIKKSFKHIYKEEYQNSGLDKAIVVKMRSELNKIFEKNYS